MGLGSMLRLRNDGGLIAFESRIDLCEINELPLGRRSWRRVSVRRHALHIVTGTDSKTKTTIKYGQIMPVIASLKSS